MDIKARIAAELEKIKKAGGGTVSAEKVVEFAKNKKSALHGEFDWSDTEAAHKWRLHQARNLLFRIKLVDYDASAPREVRKFYSLTSDRISDGGGYRDVIDIYNDLVLRNRLIDDVTAELKSKRRRFAQLSELSKVWEEIDKLPDPVSATAAAE
jgi:hypothetical protein